MLWNWYTVDTCFLSSSWHNTTLAMYAGSVVGVFALVVAIEAVRRVGREFDRKIVANATKAREEAMASRRQEQQQGLKKVGSGDNEEDEVSPASSSSLPVPAR